MLSAENFSCDLVDSFLSTGFVSTNIPEIFRGQLSEVFRSGTDFFRSDIRDKMQARLPFDNGYRPLGIEYSQTASRPDEMETFSVNYRVPAGDQVLASTIAEDLRQRMLNLFDLIEPMVEDITGRAASRLTGTPLQKSFCGSFRNWSMLQLNYSRPSSTTVDFINEAHEDGCLMTVMTVTGPGLELKVSDGSFLPIQPTGELLFISAEILNLLSGGCIPAIYHRVRAVPTLGERMSLLFFADINPTLCTPWISNETNAGIDIGRRVLDNYTRYGLTEWKPGPGAPGTRSPS
jgi:isopenicillin N synthase-like dioxygenase